MGKMGSNFTAPQLGEMTLTSAMHSISLDHNQITHSVYGNVLSAGIGQNPARQVSMFSKLSETTTCITLNKVCASGLKAIDYGSTSILLGDNDCVAVGGIENMTKSVH